MQRGVSIVHSARVFCVPSAGRRGREAPRLRRDQRRQERRPAPARREPPLPLARHAAARAGHRRRPRDARRPPLGWRGRPLARPLRPVRRRRRRHLPPRAVAGRRRGARSARSRLLLWSLPLSCRPPLAHGRPALLLRPAPSGPPDPRRFPRPRPARRPPRPRARRHARRLRDRRQARRPARRRALCARGRHRGDRGGGRQRGSGGPPARRGRRAQVPLRRRHGDGPGAPGRTGPP